MKMRRILLIGISLISLVACLGISVWGMQKRKDGNLEQQYVLIAENIYDSVEAELANPILTGKLIANNSFLVDLLENEASYSEQELDEQMRLYLEMQKEVLGAQTMTVTSEQTKRYYTDQGIQKVLNPDKDEHDGWYPVFINKKKPYDVDVDNDQVNGNAWTVFVNTRIENAQGELLGVCGVGLSMENLQTILQKYEQVENVKVSLVDANGITQLNTDSVQIEKSMLNDVAHGSEKDGYAFRNDDGEYVVMRYVDDLKWYVVVQGTYETLSMNDFKPIVFGGLGMIVINLLAALILLRRTVVVDGADVMVKSE